MSFNLVSCMLLSLLASHVTALHTPVRPDCPTGDGVIYTTSTGAKYKIECGIDHLQGDIARVQLPSGLLTDCMAACDREPGCIDVSMSGVECYMKGSVGKTVKSPTGRGALLVSQADIDSRTHTLTKAVTCPSWNEAVYKSSTGKHYTVECGVDHPGNDLKMVHVDTIELCLAQCDITPGCVDAVMSGTACYMKKALGKGQPDAGVIGARLVISKQ